ncbi:MAG: 5-aminolevulinate synthase [Holosporales bacterium]
MNFEAYFAETLARIKEQGKYRVFMDIERICGDFPHAWLNTPEGREKITVWCGNDYLGMGQNESVLSAIQDMLKQTGAGAGGTRNISGTTHSMVKLEAELASLHHKEAALVFTSGYVANQTTLSTLGSKIPGLVIFSDAHNHASMIEGIRNSRAEKVIFKHNDVDDLHRQLKSLDPKQPKMIAFESIYSMGGDIAPIEKICDVADEFQALTYLDEVHGVGMYGSHGGGIAEQEGLSHRLSLIQGTLGKAFGLIGGYITGSKHLVDFVRSFAPGFIFTTALPPALCAGATASIRHLKHSTREREIHQNNAAYLKSELSKAGIPHLVNQSHIVPVVIGDAMNCKAIADQLLHQYKIYVQPINYPTVPVGTERLRLTPSALHTFGMCDELVSALAEIWGQRQLKRAA